jgi:LacI family transcriptional regulator
VTAVAPRRLTIRSVAERAGVSLGTVSNVLNRPARVAPTTRARVLAAMDELGFVRNTAAHQLRMGNSRSVGVVVHDVSNSFFTETIRGIEDVANDNGYVVIVSSSDAAAEREERCLRLLEEQRVLGVLITPADKDLDHLARLQERGTPVILLDRHCPNGRFCSVAVDDVRGGEMAASHLFAQGHRRIALVNGPLEIRQCADRRRGVRRAARRAGLDPADAVLDVPVSALSTSGGHGAIPALLGGEPRPSGVVCANDMAATGVLRGLREAGVRVPDDMAVVGYDDIDFAAMLSPSLTSVRQPKYELGASATRLLLEEISDDDHEHREVRFEPELIVRSSSAPVQDHTGPSGPTPPPSPRPRGRRAASASTLRSARR